MLCRLRWLLFHLSAHSLQPRINLIITLSVLLQKLSWSSEQSVYSFEWNSNFGAVNVKTSNLVNETKGDRHLPSTKNLLELLHFVICTRVNILHWMKYGLMTHIWPWYSFPTGFTYINLWWKDKKKKAWEEYGKISEFFFFFTLTFEFWPGVVVCLGVYLDRDITAILFIFMGLTFVL